MFVVVIVSEILFRNVLYNCLRMGPQFAKSRINVDDTFVCEAAGNFGDEHRCFRLGRRHTPAHQRQQENSIPASAEDLPPDRKLTPARALP
jgi:hypothetical protein